MSAHSKNHPQKSLSVNILDKEYHVACPSGAEADLLLSARCLDNQMKIIRRTGKVIGLERIAVMAGLNIAYELLNSSRERLPFVAPDDDAIAQEKHTPPPFSSETASPLVNQKLNELKSRIDEALSVQPNHAYTSDIESLLWPEEKNSLQAGALEVEY